MKKKVLKWNFSVLNVDTQTIVHSVDYDYNHEEYMKAVRDMVEHLKVPKTHVFSRKIHKVRRVEQVEFPGTKQLIKLGKFIGGF